MGLLTDYIQNQRGVRNEKRRNAAASQDRAVTARTEANEEAKARAREFTSLQNYLHEKKILPKEESTTMSLEELEGAAKAAVEKQKQSKELGINELAAGIQRLARSNPEALESAGLPLPVIGALNTIGTDKPITGDQLDYLLKNFTGGTAKPGTSFPVRDDAGNIVAQFITQSPSGSGSFIPVNPGDTATPDGTSLTPTQIAPLSKELDRLQELYGAKRAAAGDPDSSGPDRRQARQEATQVQDRISNIRRLLGLGGQRPGQTQPAPLPSEVNDPLPQIYQPTTQENFQAIPNGAIYVNPADGKQYRKN